MLSALAITFLLPVYTHAYDFCVSDATGLQAALTTASGNGEDDTIQIQQGIYEGYFECGFSENFDLTVEGGYTQDCTSREVNPSNTILEGDFVSVQFDFCWSSTTYVHSTNDAWVVYMLNGAVGSNGKGYHGYVWPVRGGH